MPLSEMAFLEKLPGFCGKRRDLIEIYWSRSDSVGNQSLGERSGFKNSFNNAVFIIIWFFENRGAHQKRQNKGRPERRLAWDQEEIEKSKR